MWWWYFLKSQSRHAQSLIPSLVDKKDLPNAVALNSIQFNVARVIGPTLFSLMLEGKQRLYRRLGWSDEWTELEEGREAGQAAPEQLPAHTLG